MKKTDSKADTKTAGAAAHAARNAQLAAEGAARRAAKKDAGVARQAEYLAGLKTGAADRKAARVQAHNDRNMAAKKTAKAA